MSSQKQIMLALVADDLAGIEKALKENLNPYLDLVSETANHILFSGGKRLRPLLMILSARICGYKGDQDKKISTSFEYLHAATLLHDDLVDEAKMRRGKAAAHHIWGSSTAVLVGDFLLARAGAIATGTNIMEVIKVITDIIEEMSQGEIHQLINKGNIDLSEGDYFQVIKRKTAVLIQGACQTGAIIAGASEEEKAALTKYGYMLGIAFQMVDDLLDYTAETKSLGKETGADLKEGKLTLPVIYSLAKANSSDYLRIKEMIEKNDFSLNEFEYLKGLLAKYGGIEYTEKLAEEYVSKAIDSLLIFNQSKTRDILELLAEYTLSRKE
jgi:octaprenyl-diphosphate synthase